MTRTGEERIRIGISACLLGQQVRYDGGHKLSLFLRDTLGQHVDYVPVCPEVACGLPTPREPMHLVGDPAAPRLVTRQTGIDHTRRLLGWAHQRVRELEREDLKGFIFKARSPSCGVERVKVHDDNMVAHCVGRGLFARVLMEHSPLLPTEEGERLDDQAARERFFKEIDLVIP